MRQTCISLRTMPYGSCQRFGVIARWGVNIAVAEMLAVGSGDSCRLRGQGRTEHSYVQTVSQEGQRTEKACSGRVATEDVCAVRYLLEPIRLQTLDVLQPVGIKPGGRENPVSWLIAYLCLRR